MAIGQKTVRDYRQKIDWIQKQYDMTRNEARGLANFVDTGAKTGAGTRRTLAYRYLLNQYLDTDLTVEDAQEYVCSFRQRVIDEVQEQERLVRDTWYVTRIEIEQQSNFPYKLCAISEVWHGDHFECRFSHWMLSDRTLATEGRLAMAFGEKVTSYTPKTLWSLMEKARERGFAGFHDPTHLRY